MRHIRHDPYTSRGGKRSDFFSVSFFFLVLFERYITRGGNGRKADSNYIPFVFYITNLMLGYAAKNPMFRTVHLD